MPYTVIQGTGVRGRFKRFLINPLAYGSNVLTFSRWGFGTCQHHRTPGPRLSINSEVHPHELELESRVRGPGVEQPNISTTTVYADPHLSIHGASTVLADVVGSAPIRAHVSSLCYMLYRLFYP